MSEDKISHPASDIAEDTEQKLGLEELYENANDSRTEGETQPTEEEEEERLPETFDEILHAYPELLSQIKQMGFTVPTPVQRMAIPKVISAQDIVVQAATGSGKTLVFVLGLVAKMMREKNLSNKTTYALILAPTRELAVQICAVIRALDPTLDPTCIIGGESMQDQIDHLRQDARIVVGTPGRVRDVLRRPLSLGACRFFVLDEADEMLSIGFLQDVRAILSRLPDQRQGVFVSATITPRVEMLASAFLTKPRFMAVAKDLEQVPDISHFCVNVGNDIMAKPSALCDIIETERPISAIIFCNTRSETKLVEAFLRRRGFDARRINSDLTQKQRRKIMDRIRSQDLQFLVATDVAARGIDLEHIEIVVNYTIHDQPEVYVHRTGRTGRAGRRGRAFSLVSARDFQAFHNLKKTLEVNFQDYRLPTIEDLAGAKLAHLYEIIRKAKLDIGERDTILARNLLAELSPASTHSEDQELFIAKLAKYVFEHFLSRETGSLDEELADDAEQDVTRESSEKEREPREERSGRDGRNQRSDGGRGEREDRRQRDTRDQREDRGARDNRQNEDRNPRDRQDRRDPRGEHRQQQDNRSREVTRREQEGPRARPTESTQQVRPQERRREEHPERRDPAPAPREQYRQQGSFNEPTVLRVYVGQGTNHGLSADGFCSLVEEFAELERASLLHLSVRENYIFVDLHDKNAQKLIENLNGIEFNGESLPVELATVLADAEGRGPRSQQGDYRSGGRSDHRGGDHRNDRGGRYSRERSGYNDSRHGGGQRNDRRGGHDNRDRRGPRSRDY